MLGDTGSERIETLVVDLLERSAEAGDIVQGDDVGGAMLRLREFMFERVYLGPDAQREKDAHRADAARAVRPLRRDRRRADAPRSAWSTGWPGMTDRYAVRAFSELSVPQGF